LKQLEENKSKIENLEKELKTAKSQGLIDKLEDALKDFTDEQKDVVKNEIQEFKSNPASSKIQVEDIIQKILADIGKNLLQEKQSTLSEQNSFRYSTNDILGEVFETNSKTFSIF